jgi:uncharacterized SAM-binding protein YcdF (DUF218 family)
MRRWDPTTPLRALQALPRAARSVTDGARVARSPERVDAIVVLGAAVLPGGAPSRSLQARVAGALEAWRDGRAPIVVCTGAHHLNPPGEAVVAAGLLEAEGVPRAALVLEEKSRTTLGNLSYAHALLRAHLPEGGAKAPRVLVVTEPFHMGRALHLAREVGLDAHPWPVSSPAWERPAARLRWLARDVASLALHLGSG